MSARIPLRNCLVPAPPFARWILIKDVRLSLQTTKPLSQHRRRDNFETVGLIIEERVLAKSERA